MTFPVEVASKTMTAKYRPAMVRHRIVLICPCEFSRQGGQTKQDPAAKKKITPMRL
jgi:hypothetical protein